MASKSQPLDWLVLTTLVIAWGSSFAMTKFAVTSLDASWVMALRLTVAAAILVPYAWLSGHPVRASGSAWGKFTWLGLVGHATPFFLITWGTHFVSSGISGLLMAFVPLFLVILAHFALPDEPLTWPKAVGFMLGFAGMIVLIGPDKLLHLSLAADALKGELAILGGSICYAVHAVSAKRLGIEDPVRQTASVCLIAAIIGLAFAAVTSPQGLAGHAPSVFWAVAGLGVIPTAFASLLMYHLMLRVGPSFVAYSNYLVPIYAVLFGALLFAEELSWNVLTALVLVLAGIAVSRSKMFSLRRKPA
jgi:drug/metabolite transporter (DMT)-like permease